MKSSNSKSKRFACHEVLRFEQYSHVIHLFLENISIISELLKFRLLTEKKPTEEILSQSNTQRKVDRSKLNDVFECSFESKCIDTKTFHSLVIFHHQTNQSPGDRCRVSFNDSKFKK
jgi:hypothetical protein